MFETISALFTSQNTVNTHRTLTYVKNERMGGFVPKYVTGPKPQEITQSITIEQTTPPSGDVMAGAQGQDNLAYNEISSVNEMPEQQDDQFGFKDLIDMVNPLHHIPVVGHVYRELSGDQIKPIGKIVGSAAFGGPLGIATALIDSVVTNETGQDMASNAIDVALGKGIGKKPEPVSTFAQIETAASKPQTAKQATKSITNDAAMTQALLAYSNLSANDDNNTISRLSSATSGSYNYNA